jgi:hypothetical protein
VPEAVEQLLDPRPPKAGAGGQGGPSCAAGAAWLPRVCAAALGRGFTLSLRELSQRWAPAAAVADALEAQLGLPAGGNLYCTPEGARLHVV